MKKLILFVISALLVLACGQRGVVLPVEDATAVHSIEVLSDGSYFSEVASMKFYDGRIYACSMESSQILCMDTDFGLLNKIGRKGRGTEELMDPSSFDICRDGLAVYSYGMFKHYTHAGDFVKSCSISRSMPNKNFAWSGECYYYSTRTDGPMIEFSPDGRSSSFGEYHLFDNENQTSLKNARHTLIYEDNIIAVSDNLPIIEFYDKATLGLIKKIDYSRVDLVDKIIKKNSEEHLADNQYRILVSKCYISDGKLYLLLADNLDSYLVNKVLVLDIAKDFSPIRIIKLPGESYFSFCVGDGYIYAFNTRKNLFEKIKI